MASDGGEKATRLKLYSYWGSSCSCRVRIALGLKGLDYDYVAVNVLKGENKNPEFLKLNPLGYVPVLVDGDTVIADSFPILLYLEEKYPQHPLLPQDLQKKALSIQASSIVSSSIQPFQNLPSIGYIKEKLGEDEMLRWVHMHIKNGFVALEMLLGNHAAKYAMGDEVSLVDLVLAPQIDVAVRLFNVNMSEFLVLAKINESYRVHPAFQVAMPGKQPDTPPVTRD